jgi:hypothetical protein
MKLSDFQWYSFALKMKYAPAIGDAGHNIAAKSCQTICAFWVYVLKNIPSGECASYNHTIPSVPRD